MPLDRVEFLDQVRKDPRGWPSTDLGTLLAAWDFRVEESWVVRGCAHEKHVHREEHDLNVTLPVSGEISPSTADFVVRLIETLRQRKSI